MACDAPISLQQSFWNQWNASYREKALDEVSTRQAEVVADGWMRCIGTISDSRGRLRRGLALPAVDEIWPGHRNRSVP